MLNVQAVKGKLPFTTRGQRLHHFFLGVPEQLTEKEKTELRKVLDREHTRLIKFIENSKPLIKKTA
jgi:hypothetical protein